jgi:hypothetical protein
MTRKQVESYLRGKSIQFGQVCCFDYEGAYADRIAIDPGKGDWICRSYNTYLLFQFAAKGPRPVNVMTEPDDTLKRITIRMIPEGCL